MAVAVAVVAKPFTTAKVNDLTLPWWVAKLHGRLPTIYDIFAIRLLPICDIPIGCSYRQLFQFVEYLMSKTAFKTLRKRLGCEVTRKPLDAFSFPGGYPIGYLCADGGVLCASCINSEIELIHDARLEPRLHKDWHVVSMFNAGDLEDDFYCDHCNRSLDTSTHAKRFMDNPHNNTGIALWNGLAQKCHSICAPFDCGVIREHLRIIADYEREQDNVDFADFLTSDFFSGNFSLTYNRHLPADECWEFHSAVQWTGKSVGPSAKRVLQMFYEHQIAFYNLIAE